eukprot:TRINITY_DN5725_c0_g1_i1.p2 TRINITY_DN5725_c0_g1~~TRINITY_DN5725_c0_g1_i1.p2  ORF type:complete len:137 (-),score=18.18 TRINITY_DN5725_c0_g1_i1:282-692(-)
MNSLVKEFVNIRHWAVVGVSTDTSKFGYKIFRKLVDSGYSVFGVNPRGGVCDGHTLKPTLSALSGEVPFSELVVDVVVPPAATEAIVKECKELGIRRVWMQPGAESTAAIDFCNENGIAVVHQRCALVEHQTWPKI